MPRPCLEKVRILPRLPNDFVVQSSRIESCLEFEFGGEMEMLGNVDGDHLALRTYPIATCTCVAPVRWRLGLL